MGAAAEEMRQWAVRTGDWLDEHQPQPCYAAAHEAWRDAVGARHGAAIAVQAWVDGGRLRAEVAVDLLRQASEKEGEAAGLMDSVAC